MRQFTCFLLALVFSSCVTRMPVYEKSFSLDYQRYIDEGFYISDTGATDFEYIEISLVVAISRSGSGDRKADQNVTLNHAVDLLRKEAVAQGADGIIRLKIDPFLFQVLEKGVGVVTKVGFNVSGMAIKRQ